MGTPKSGAGRPRNFGNAAGLADAVIEWAVSQSPLWVKLRDGSKSAPLPLFPLKSRHSPRRSACQLRASSDIAAALFDDLVGAQEE